MPSRIMLTAALTLALGLSACGDDQAPTLTQKTLTFTERETDNNFGFTDNAPKTKIGDEGPERLSNGDAFTFSGDLLDGSGKDRGELDTSCAVTRPGGFDEAHLQCTATATVPGGTITLARGGRVFAGADPRGAVLGGTGTYAGATGDFTEGEESAGRTPYTFHLWLPRR